MIKKQSGIFLMIMILMAGCNNSKKTAASTDTGNSKLNGTWELNYITGPRIAFNGLFPGKKPTVVFTLPSLEANGNTSCNPFSCNFTVTASKINFADPRSTMMACEGGSEQLFLTTLKQVNAYNITSDTTLAFIMGDIAVMRFAKK